MVFTLCFRAQVKEFGTILGYTKVIDRYIRWKGDVLKEKHIVASLEL